MWSSKALARRALLSLALAFPAAFLAGCTLTPVYGDRGAGTEAALVLNYAEPTSRLGQIVAQELARRLGSGTGPDVPVARISAVQGARTLARSQTTNPSKPYEAVVIATLTVVDPQGQVLLTVTRQANAGYTTNGQVLADKAAEADAAERAARSVAESLRLTLLATLPGARAPQ